MAWHEKEATTSIDQFPIPGLYYLDGDIASRVLMAKYGKGEAPLMKKTGMEGMKYPQVLFPSGMEFPVWEGKENPIIHIYGEMDLPFYDNRDRAFEQANDIAEQCGYLAFKKGEHQLEVIGHEGFEHFVITYDPEKNHLANIEPAKEKQEKPPHLAHILMPDEVREKLPPIRDAQEQGAQAIAQVKYFTPSGGWTWYATGFDGKNALTGLVIGHEIEPGAFFLSELQEVSDPLGLPIERDLYFKPQTIEELWDFHRKMQEEAAALEQKPRQGDKEYYLIDETNPEIAQDTYNAISERVMLGVTLGIITPEEGEIHLGDIQKRMLPSDDE